MPDSLDTNVVVYAFDNDEPEKQKRAQELMREHPDAVVSTQVLLEWFTVVTRKFNPPMPPAEAVDALRGLAELDVTSVDAELVVRAAETSVDHQLSIWDAMILETANLAGCATLWSEDLNGGADIRGVAIRNPFAE